MNFFLFDASALIKRYFVEIGTPLVNMLFFPPLHGRLACLTLGAAEVTAALVRKRNGGALTQALFTSAMVLVRSEVLNSPGFYKIHATDPLINHSIFLQDKYALNATDAILLEAALDHHCLLKSAGHNLILVASDQRLLKATQGEGIQTFDPENQTQADLASLIGP